MTAICAATLALAVRIPMLDHPGFPSDMTQFVFWGDLAHRSDVSWLYSQRPDGKRIANYPPGYLYLLKGVAALHDWIAPADQALGLYTLGEIANSKSTPIAHRAYVIFKLPAVLADTATAALLVFWLSRRTRWQIAAMIGCIYALLPSVWHNSALWGQMDAIPTLLMLCALEAASRGQVFPMILSATAALLFKVQAAMLIPVWAVVCAIHCKQAPRDVIRALVAAAVLVAIVLWPLRAHLDGVWEAYAGAAKYYPYTHLNGFSFWFWLDPIDRSHLAENLNQYYIVDNTWAMLILPPRLWGMILLGSVWIYTSIVTWRTRADENSLRWAACVLPLAFFCLSTQMHERYLFPAVALWAWAFQPKIAWWRGWAIIASVAFINAAWVWPGFGKAASTSMDRVLHTPWLGLPPGVWCSIALGLLLLVTMTQRPRRAPQAQLVQV